MRAVLIMAAILAVTLLPVPQSAQARTLEGSVEMEVGPPAEDNLPALEWDGWRNRFAKAAWERWGEKLQGGISVGGLKLGLSSKARQAFPDGMRATFHCTVTRQRRIANLLISESSGDERFDELVLASVRSLSGNRLLEFPALSKRPAVEQACTFRIGKTEFREQQTGEKERLIN